MSAPNCSACSVRSVRSPRSARSPRAAAFAFALALSVASTAPNARADPPSADPWLAPDKALHFGASALIAGGGYAGSALFTDELAGRIAFGAALAVGAGIAKEALDATGLGDPSARDFTWDLVGTAVGVGIAVTVNIALDGAPKPARSR